jgi:Lysyl oxidase
MKQRIAIGLSAAVLLAGTFAVAPRVRGQSSGKPDLIVDQAALRQHWVVRTEDLPATFCSVQEGGITPGEHQLVRFTVATPNIGDADLAVGDPNVHIAANDGLFEFATCHNHYHFRHYALYQLIDPATGYVWRAAKRGFCMIDIEKFQDYTGDADNKRHFASCGAVGIPGNQGISKGWSDVYVWKLGGQYFLLDGGDGQAEVPPGEYIIRITVNPPFVPAAGEPCPNVDPAGFCHTLPESDYANNVAQVSITIPDHNGRQSVGPLKNEPILTTEPIDGK